METSGSAYTAGTQISGDKSKTDANNETEGSSGGANASTSDTKIADESKIEEDTKEENKKEYDEEKAKNAIIRSLEGYISKNFERLGNRFKRMNQQEKYESFENRITRLEQKMDYKVNDQGWKDRIIIGCLVLFEKDTLSLETVKEHLKEFWEQAAD